MEDKLEKINRRNELAIIDILRQKMHLHPLEEEKEGEKEEGKPEEKGVFSRETTYQE